MDISETYIKMCENAREIQLLKPMWSKKDFYHHPQGHHYLDMTYDVWLPRQDQCQEMVGGWTEDEAGFVQLLHDFDWFIEICETKMLHSMEQLWLAFVMKTLYSKIWDGEDWIKEK